MLNDLINHMLTFIVDFDDRLNRHAFYIVLLYIAVIYLLIKV